jgi:hypothetical protein
MPPDISNINISSSDQEIVEFCRQAIADKYFTSSHQQDLYLNYGISLLNLKQQQRLQKEQQNYNNTQLFWSRILTIATIVTALATIALIKFR